MEAGMPVRYQHSDGIGVITLDRPEARNAIDKATAEELSDALDAFELDESAVVGLLRSTGSTFCAGVDLRAFHATGDLPVTKRRGGLGMVEKPLSKPMVAAVQGHAVGGGFELALTCDLIVAEADAVFGLPEVRFGLVPAGGGLLRLPGRIPRAIAFELMLTGDNLGADRAAQLGLVNRVVPIGTSFDEAMSLARRVAANAPLSVRAVKKVFDESRDWSISTAFERQALVTDPVLASEDAAEGARAFTERRQPKWNGK
jgi:enoyl-CoA hydratase/carnithine racemase